MWAELQNAIDAGAVIAYGATPGWAAWLAAERSKTEMLVVVAADDATAQALEEDIRFWVGEPADSAELDPIASLPGIDVSPYAELSPDRGCIVERVATLYRLTQPEFRPRILITSAEALARKALPASELAQRGLVITKGQNIDRDAIAKVLTDGGWTRTPVVDEPGTFALRGGVVDVYAPLAPHPVRIELFGDEVETLRWFDAESQRTLREVSRVVLHPVRETIVTGTSDVRTRLRDYAEEISFPSKATRRTIEQLETGAIFVGIEGLIPAFHDELVSPATYVPADARWLIVDSDACRRAISDLVADADLRWTNRQNMKELAYPPDRHFDRVLPQPPRRIEISSLETTQDSDATKLRIDVDDLRVLRQLLDHARTFGDTEHVQPLLDALKKWRSEGVAVTLALDSQSRVDRLAGVLEQRGVKDVTITSGAPAHAFASLKDRVALVTGDLIFGQRTHHAQNRRKKAKDALLGGVSDWSQLGVGDYLVHQKHGVGKYLGLKKIAVGTISLLETVAIGGTARPPQHEIDALQLEYDGGTLYLPVYRLGEVQRYVGAEGHAPKIDKLGGITWEATQTKVSRTVRALAEELLQVYAQRAALPGFSFPPPDDQYRELEATFPFDETPDQEDAINAIMADMEAGKSMDRLVCGDVGYGKTEVALRAIFKCITGGKQAAVLAPTTVLVEQHFRTMQARFKGFAVKIGKLSRFQTKAQQIETVKELAAGTIDVVVGTHRLLSADVRFKDLGLLVIDEEQRFGVAHKERIKKTKTTVDVLTLTATPIPRTLHLAMAGMRDLSIIATPPADRRAVRTFVSRVDDVTIKEAIERELARGGQIFFITPTIGGIPKGKEPEHRLPNDDRPQPRKTKPRDDDRGIDEWLAYLQGLVPNARIGIGHGALAADALEKVMVQFINHELDILIATTIVESGLDIPNANTMFVARADAFGLAQLYQLRGRIGRSANRAYCYLLVPEPEHITDDARRRLEALQRFTELGAGFQIASQDLEIRGGGELLGAKQSGSIAAVGFDRYVKMLEVAVAELRGQPIHSEIDPELQVDNPGFIPDDYVPDPGQRLELYKRLSAVADDDELRVVMTEISDRYGPLPGDVVLLGELMGQKALARKLGALAMEISGSRVALALPEDSPARAWCLAAGWRKLPDGRFATAPPARPALRAVFDRATASA
ncbi:MAG: transcription-repair coupling factor [Kofleriaceae bacterium]